MNLSGRGWSPQHMVSPFISMSAAEASGRLIFPWGPPIRAKRQPEPHCHITKTLRTWFFGLGGRPRVPFLTSCELILNEPRQEEESRQRLRSELRTMQLFH